MHRSQSTSCIEAHGALECSIGLGRGGVEGFEYMDAFPKEQRRVYAVLCNCLCLPALYRALGLPQPRIHFRFFSAIHGLYVPAHMASFNLRNTLLDTLTSTMTRQEAASVEVEVCGT